MKSSTAAARDAALARAQRLIPDVQTHLMAGANHMLTIDCPDELGAAMLKALALIQTDEKVPIPTGFGTFRATD